MMDKCCVCGKELTAENTLIIKVTAYGGYICMCVPHIETLIELIKKAEEKENKK